MDRRVFIRQTAVVALGSLAAFDLSKASAKNEMAFAGKGKISPRAITMWDFSWLESCLLYTSNGDFRRI